MLSGEATNTNFIVFDLTQQGQNAQSSTVTHANHFTNDMVCNQFVIREKKVVGNHTWESMMTWDKCMILRNLLIL